MDSSELALADDWDVHWNNLRIAAERNPAQRFRQRTIAGFIGRLEPDCLVDIGCGQGDFLALLALRFPKMRLIGVEPSQTGAEATKRVVPSAQVQCLDIISQEVPVDIRAVADAAVCMEVLEHLDDPAGLVRSVKSIMRPGGLIIVTVPGGRMSDFDRVIGHRRHYSPGEMASMLESEGLLRVSAWTEGFPALNFYRGVVIGRGAKLAADVYGEPSRAASIAMHVFDVLLRHVAFRTAKIGPQTVAVGYVP
jgi:SAM-dependent methyltransferase